MTPLIVAIEASLTSKRKPVCSYWNAKNSSVNYRLQLTLSLVQYHSESMIIFNYCLAGNFNLILN